MNKKKSTYPYTPTVLPQKTTVAAQIFQSESPARICCLPILSAFVVWPWPEPASLERRATRRSRSGWVRNFAVSGLSGRIFQMTRARAMGMRPSIRKIHLFVLAKKKEMSFL